MAPTIFTEKKRQMRGCRKQISQHTTTAPAVSSILNYVAKGSARTSATMRIHGSAFHNVSRAEHNDTQMCENTQRVGKISEATVSSSSSNSIENDSGLGECNDSSQLKRSNSTSSTSSSPRIDSTTTNQAIAYQYSPDMHHNIGSDESTTADDDDHEVHSIISGNRCVYIDRNGNDGNIGNRRRYCIKRQTPHRTVFNEPKLSDKQPDTQQKMYFTNGTHCKTYSDICKVKNTEDLLAIAIKTIKLVKRNQLLQQRLAELQLETSEFIQSVLANPENRHFREKMKQHEHEVKSK